MIPNLNSLKEHMQQNIGHFLDDINNDGRWHDGGIPPNQNKCRYIVIPHVKGYIVRYKDHRQGDEWHTWYSWADEDIYLSPAEYANRKAEIDRQNAQREKAEAAARKQRIAAQRKIWATAQPANQQHPYLQKKQVGVFGIRQKEQSLLVPIRDISGQLQALQYIYPVKREINGKFTDKLILGSKRSNFHHISSPRKPTDTIFIAEGYATGATLHQFTGQCVVIAFDTGNLLPVGMAIRSKYPQVQLVFAADNDVGVITGDIENPGIHYARQAALACNGCVLIPNTTQKADFNDLITGEVA